MLICYKYCIIIINLTLLWKQTRPHFHPSLFYHSDSSLPPPGVFPIRKEDVPNIAENAVAGESDMSFELLENYKERNLPPVYTQDNETERYCNVLLNRNREIEYYTLAKESDGYLCTSKKHAATQQNTNRA